MKAIRWIGRGLAAVGVLLSLVYGAIYARTEWLAQRRVTLASQSPPLIIHTDSASRARGRHIVQAVSGCVHCHGSDLGGSVVVDEPFVMRLTAPNLTSGTGGMLPYYSDAALERAIRHGVAYDGRVLRVMPSDEYVALADDDVAAMIAYIRTRPAVDRKGPPFVMRPLIRALTVAGKVRMFPYDHIDHARSTRSTAPTGRSVERGRYLSSTCSGCHKTNFAGGPITGAPPDWPPSANLTPAGIGAWSDADFLNAMRTGVRPDGTSINTAMPWELLGKMTDDELISLRWYLATVPSRAKAAR
jgi:cytochrome c553